jgi:hypothetical protein
MVDFPVTHFVHAATTKQSNLRPQFMASVNAQLEKLHEAQCKCHWRSMTYLL